MPWPLEGIGAFRICTGSNRQNGPMLLHLRLNLPAPLSHTVAERWAADERMTDVSLHRGASLRPEGDVLEADVAREAVSDVLDELTDLGADRVGGIVMTQPRGTPFEAATEVDRAASGDPDDAVLWRVVEEEAEESSRITPSFLFFLAVAVALAGIAVITDSSVLVVGAMVVGPEFSMVAAVCTGLALGRWRLAGRAMANLATSFVVATALVALVAWIAVLVGILPAHALGTPRPQTEFIWRPNVWSFVVALLAGAAGVWALATDKTSAMVGVFISVTTVPAAGNLALGAALGNLPEMVGSAGQLGINVAGMLLAGVTTLLVQRVVWRRLGAERRHRLGRAVDRRR